MYKVLLDNRTGKDLPFKTTLSYKMSGQNLEFVFECDHSEYFSAYSVDNEPIFMGDVVEVFIGIGKNPKEYYELELAPNGTRFFGKIKNNGGKLKVELLSPEFNATVERTKSGYKSVIAIKESVITKLGKGKIYFNAYRIETEGGEAEKHLIALSPTLSSTFHKPEYFIPFDED